MRAPQHPAELDPAHARHDDVREDDVEALARLEQVQGLLGVGGPDGLVADVLQELGREPADLNVVLDHEHAAAPSVLDRSAVAHRRAVGGLLGLHPRKIQGEYGAAAQVALDAHVAAGLLGEAVNLRQAEPGAPADLLGGEEGFEDLPQLVGRNAAARVPDQHRDELALSAAVSPDGRDLRHLGHADRERALTVHGVARVHGHVDHRGLELAEVGLDIAGLAGDPRVDADARPDDAAQHVGHGLHALAHVEDFRLEGLPAREGEQLPGQLGGAVHRVRNSIDVALAAPVGEVGAAQQVGGRLDDRQQVVEVVRHAPGQLPHGFELLRLAQRVLGGGQRRGLLVLEGGVAPARVDAARVEGAGPGEPAVRAVPVAEPVHVGPRQRGLDDARQARHGGLQVLGVGEARQARAHELALLPAEQDRPGRVDGGQTRVGLQNREQVLRQAPRAVAFPRALGDPRFERGVHVLQRRLGAGAGDRDPRALRHLADQGEFVARPGARGRVVEVEQRHGAALLGDRDVDHRLRADGLQGLGVGSRAGVLFGIGEHHRLAAPQVVDVGPVVPEAEHAREALDPRRVPVAVDRHGFGREVDGAVAGPADVQGPAEDRGGHEAEVGRPVEVTEAVAEVDKREAVGFGRLPGRDVDRDAGHAERRAVGRADRLPAHVYPAGRSVRPHDAVVLVVVGSRRHGAVDRGHHPVPVARMEARAQVGVGERRGGVVAVVFPAHRRCRELPGAQVEFPHAEPPRFGREPEAGLAFPQRVQAARHLGHQGGIVGFQPRQALPLQRDVDLAREEIGEVARRVPHGREQQPVPERFAGLAVVADVDLDRLGRVHGPADERHRGGVCVGSLQEPAVAPEDFSPLVAREAAERVVGEHHGIVGLARVGDDHGHARRPHRGRERVGAPVRAGDPGHDPFGFASDILASRPVLPLDVGIRAHGSSARSWSSTPTIMARVRRGKFSTVVRERP